ncbi:MAG: superfamily II DNA or RNA helicase [Limisphaerales bacterium]|jgi:superfamily II DNA or RNA helicase
MSFTELTEAFLAESAGGEAVARAHSMLTDGKVLSSNWSPPLLKGVVQERGVSYRAGLVIKGSVDIDNLCTCRSSREAGIICAHSVAVGLRHLQHGKSALRPAATATPRRSGDTATPLPPGMGRPAPRLPEREPEPPPGPKLRRSAKGRPVEFFVSLPADFAARIARGSVMVRFEAEWQRGRGPMSGLPMKQPFAISPEDTRLLDKAEELAGDETPGGLILDLAELTQLFDALVGHPRVTLGREQPLKVSAFSWRAPIELTLNTSGEILMNLPADFQGPTLIPGDSLWALRGSSLEPVGLPNQWRSVLQAPLTLPRAKVPFFLNQDLAVLEAESDVDANFTIDEFTLEPQPPRFILALDGGLNQVKAQLQCAYGPRIMTVGVTSKDESLWLPDPKCVTRYSTRAFGAEVAAGDRMRKAGFSGPDAQGRWNLHGESKVVTFFAKDYPRLQKEWDVTLEKRLQQGTVKNFERLEPRFEIRPSGEGWFDVDMSLASADGQKFSAVDIQRLILSGNGTTRLNNGRIALIDTTALEEFNATLRDCAPQQHAGGFRLNDVQAGYVDATLRQQPGWQVQASPDWRQRASQQSGETKLDCPPLGKLEDVLRPYQKHGVGWMQFLRENKFGGILADEMGLGKTLQTLAFIQSNHTNKTLSGPVLIVCPTSLIFNWIAEAKKFTPQLKVVALHGAGRGSQFKEIAKSDIAITSYGLIRRDAEKHLKFNYDTLVLDEAQHIKNRQTQNSQAVKTVRAKHRVVLTGTPMENSVLDLWSIFDFLMPGYLGSARDFRERYEQPITRDKDEAAQARLGRRLRPFILRRLKAEVAKDLPAKLEQVSYCELTGDQMEIYKQVLAVSRREVTNAVGAQGVAKSKMIVLNALMRLRQICCDLRLLKMKEPKFTDASSGKMAMFSELLEQAIDGGHRVLVFSQFTTMLGLLKDKLAAEKIDYCYLDGSTTNRGAVVEKFQGDAKIPVFLISLKAGGVGLTLTGADTVVHFDPWWNPAVEDQATDRAHRIGQTRVVTSYKLIARGTVEEKILALQKKKRAIIKATLGGEETLGDNLTWEEIQEIFA